MNARQTREFATIVNSHEFLRRNASSHRQLAPIAAALGDVIGRVHALNTATTLAGKSSFGKAIQNSATMLRRAHMIPIARRGKILFRGDVDIENALRVPHGRSQPAVIVAAADEMIARIAPHQKLFFKYDFSRSFLADMRKATKELSRMVDASGVARASSPGDFTALQRQISRGRAEIGAADGVILGWLLTVPPTRRGTLAREWRTAHRITNRLGRPSKRRKAYEQ